jgi:hypothetical protein
MTSNRPGRNWLAHPFHFFGLITEKAIRGGSFGNVKKESIIS